MQDTLDLKQLEQWVENDKRGAATNPFLKIATTFSNGVILLMVLLGFVVIFSPGAFTSFFEMIPESLNGVLLLGMFLVLTFSAGVTLYGFVRAKGDKSNERMVAELERMLPPDPLPKSRFGWLSSGALTVIVVGWVFLSLSMGWSFLAALFSILVPLVAVIVVVELVGKYFVMNGKFAAAQRWANFVLRFLTADSSLYASMVSLRAHATLFGGKSNDSIDDFVLALTLARRARNPRQVSGTLNNLGYALVLAGRYEEALPLLESALRIKPDLSNAYDSLACWYLEQGVFPQRALQIAQEALEHTPKTKSVSRAIQLATGARAYALTKNETYTRALLGEALAMAGKGSMDAEIYRQAGHAMKALGDQQSAAAHFKRAVQLNPQGIFGKKAQQALEGLKG
jgi:tetratricopeptide (TPR) repeat protein